MLRQIPTDLQIVICTYKCWGSLLRSWTTLAEVLNIMVGKVILATWCLKTDTSIFSWPCMHSAPIHAAGWKKFKTTIFYDHFHSMSSSRNLNKFSAAGSFCKWRRILTSKQYQLYRKLENSYHNVCNKWRQQKLSSNVSLSVLKPRLWKNK